MKWRQFLEGPRVAERTPPRSTYVDSPDRRDDSFSPTSPSYSPTSPNRIDMNSLHSKTAHIIQSMAITTIHWTALELSTFVRMLGLKFASADELSTSIPIQNFVDTLGKLFPHVHDLVPPNVTEARHPFTAPAFTRYSLDDLRQANKVSLAVSETSARLMDCRAQNESCVDNHLSDSYAMLQADIFDILHPNLRIILRHEPFDTEAIPPSMTSTSASTVGPPRSASSASASAGSSSSSSSRSSTPASTSTSSSSPSSTSTSTSTPSAPVSAPTNSSSSNLNLAPAQSHLPPGSGKREKSVSPPNSRKSRRIWE